MADIDSSTDCSHGQEKCFRCDSLTKRIFHCPQCPRGTPSYACESCLGEARVTCPACGQVANPEDIRTDSDLRSSIRPLSSSGDGEARDCDTVLDCDLTSSLLPLRSSWHGDAGECADAPLSEQGALNDSRVGGVDVQLLMIIAIDNLFVHRSKVGKLRGKPCTGLDGSSRKDPFYVRDGFVGLLKDLIGLGESLKVCLFTRWSHWTCQPILAWLHSHAGLEHVHCFDATNGRTYSKLKDLESCLGSNPSCGLDKFASYFESSDQAHVRLHHLDDLREAFSAKTGLHVPREKSMLVTSADFPVPLKDKQYTARMPLFALDESVCEHLQPQLSEELDRVRHIFDESRDHLVSDYLANIWTPYSLPLGRRPFESQYADPPPRITGINLSLCWTRKQDWLCADGVEVLEANILIGRNNMSWAGARSTSLCVKQGCRMDVVVEVLSEVVVRLGWSTALAKEVGTDEFSYGFGSTAKRSHKGDFEKYGNTYSKGNCVKSRLVRTKRFNEIYFWIDGCPCSASPAFTFEADEDLFFAVCGRPGFEVKVTVT